MRLPFLALVAAFLLLGAAGAADTGAADAVSAPSNLVDVSTGAALTDTAAESPEAAVAAEAIATALHGVPVADPGAAVGAVVTAAGAGATLPLVSALIFLLLTLLRVPVVRSWVTRLIPMRWVSVVAVALGVLWSVLDQAGTAGWTVALVDGFLAGGGAVALYEVVVRAALGKDAREKQALEAAYAAAVERGDLAPLRALAGGAESKGGAKNEPQGGSK